MRCLFRGKRGPKPSFVNVPCPNKNCKDYGKIGNDNVLGNGTYTNQKKGECKVLTYYDIIMIFS
ncbi:MAG: hypothetical protein LBT66_07385, partial [Methanobrevibacter sp.]|nr:hypothetical protein [Candidatus Methanovirga meridionalis]